MRRVNFRITIEVDRNTEPDRTNLCVVSVANVILEQPAITVAFGFGVAAFEAQLGAEVGQSGALLVDCAGVHSCQSTQ